MVVPQQPVRLVQPVLPQQGRLEALGRGEQPAVRHRHIGGVEYPLQPVLVVQPLGQHQNLPVALRRGADDHLGGLPCRGEPGGVSELGQLRLGGGDAVPDLGHGGQDVGLFLVRSQQSQGGFRGQLNVDAEPVRQQAKLFHQLR